MGFAGDAGTSNVLDGLWRRTKESIPPVWQPKPRTVARFELVWNDIVYWSWANTGDHLMSVTGAAVHEAANY
jgi:hypothetical protein